MIEPMRDLSKMSIEQKVQEQERYIRNLHEYLMWQFENLGVENFNDEIKGE